jgi:hypothetical protein
MEDLDQYVNDRPYTLSSFTSVAMGRALGTAMTGRSKGRQELAEKKIPLTAVLSVVACRGGDALLRELRPGHALAHRTGKDGAPGA